MLTEQRNPKSAALDQMTTLDVLKTMNDEDATVAAAVREALPQIAALVDATAERLGRGGRLIYVGAGTSGRLGVLDAAECLPTFSVSPEMVQAIIAGGNGAMFKAVEGAEDDREAGAAAIIDLSVSENDGVVGIAASGRTPFVLGAVEQAKQLGAVTGGIACNAPAALLDAVQHPVPLLVGPEVLTGSTRLKAGTAQKLALNGLVATIIAVNNEWGFVMVNAGRQHGVGAESSLLVRRGNTRVARLRIVNLQDNMLVADVVKESLMKGFKVQPGDKVIFEDVN